MRTKQYSDATGKLFCAQTFFTLDEVIRDEENEPTRVYYSAEQVETLLEELINALISPALKKHYSSNKVHVSLAHVAPPIVETDDPRVGFFAELRVEK